MIYLLLPQVIWVAFDLEIKLSTKKCNTLLIRIFRFLLWLLYGIPYLFCIIFITDLKNLNNSKYKIDDNREQFELVTYYELTILKKVLNKLKKSGKEIISLTSDGENI